MQSNIKWLQLFADGGEGDGAASGENSSDAAGQGRTQADDLRALGVPEDKIRDRYKNTASRTRYQQVAPAEQPKEEPNEKPKEAKRLTWDEILKDPEYNKAMQDTVAKRVKENKAEGAKTAGIMELIAQKYGIKDAKDYDSISRAIEADDAVYEQKALDLGVSIEVAKKMDSLERQVKRDEEERKANEERIEIEKHFNSLLAQEQALKAKVPNFDLQTELQNPQFMRLTSPQVGMSVEDAFYAIHHSQIEQMQAQQKQLAMNQVAAQTAQAVSSNIQAGLNRPIENAGSPQTASLGQVNYKNFTKEQRAEIRRQAELAKARGEVYRPSWLG